LTRKDYVDGLIMGLDWQESVIDIVDNTAVPPTEVTGDRYLLDATGGGVHANWDGAAVNDIVEFDGTNWFVAYTAVGDEGGSCWVEDEDTNYVWNGTIWAKFGSTVTHNNTSGLQGGTSSEYYHMTSAQHTAGTRDATNSQNGLMPTGKLTNWDGAYSHSTVSSGNPHSVTPTELSLVIGTNTQAFGAILDDLNTLGAPASDGQFIVATGPGVFAYESTTTARTSLGLGTGDSPAFAGGTYTQVLDLSGVNKIHQLSGHNFLQGDATTTYLYGGSAGISIRKSDNSVDNIVFPDAGGIDIVLGDLVVGVNSTVQGIGTFWDGGGGNTPGHIIVGSPNGTLWYLFVEDDGTVKIHNATPTANADGSAIGDQTD